VAAGSIMYISAHEEELVLMELERVPLDPYISQCTFLATQVTCMHGLNHSRGKASVEPTHENDIYTTGTHACIRADRSHISQLVALHCIINSLIAFACISSRLQVCRPHQFVRRIDVLVARHRSSTCVPVNASQTGTWSILRIFN